jgi:hypothetical protein
MELVALNCCIMSIFYYCRICDIFDEMLDRASELPETTAELVELQNYLTDCREVTMSKLKEKIQTAAENVLFLMQHALLSRKGYFILEIVINEVIFVNCCRVLFIYFYILLLFLVCCCRTYRKSHFWEYNNMFIRMDFHNCRRAMSLPV